MKTEVTEIRESLISMLKIHQPLLKITLDSFEKFEVTGTVEAMQGKKKVAGIYFSSVVPKAKDVRFYFFPIYTHAAQFKEIPPALKKCLKGKSCFHIKKMNQELEDSIKALIEKGIQIYKKEGLL